MSQPPQAADRLIVALDVPTWAEADQLVRDLKGLVRRVKVGHTLFTACGPDAVHRLIEAGLGVFLDLKYHDIPATVSGAARSAARMGVEMFNVHALGGSRMMAACAEALAEEEASGLHRPRALAVTLLTSVDERVMEEVRLEGEPASIVTRLAALAARAGLDGVVASPREVEALRSARDPDFLIVVPGVRPAGADADDHARSSTPRAAIAAGADCVVVGRPITQASNPAGAAEALIAEIADGLADAGEGSP
jgi:orotidine-5'-phosphate decarboxylase